MCIKLKVDINEMFKSDTHKRKQTIYLDISAVATYVLLIYTKNMKNPQMSW